tara:strand:+ start:27145 stop:27255 length:111 start_codon:yes stop_codon:yes gene_type:complete
MILFSTITLIALIIYALKSTAPKLGGWLKNKESSSD